jgi:hypothetical protein
MLSWNLSGWLGTCSSLHHANVVRLKSSLRLTFAAPLLAIGGFWSCVSMSNVNSLQRETPDSGQSGSDASGYENLFRCDEPTPVERGGAVELCANGVLHTPRCSGDLACGANVLPNHLLATQGPGWCNTDFECGVGLMCIESKRFLSEQDPCTVSARLEGFACQTTADSCGSDADCTSGECVFSRARHQCVTRPSPNCPRVTIPWQELIPIPLEATRSEDAGLPN